MSFVGIRKNIAPGLMKWYQAVRAFGGFVVYLYLTWTRFSVIKRDVCSDGVSREGIFIPFAPNGIRLDKRRRPFWSLVVMRYKSPPSRVSKITHVVCPNTPYCYKETMERENVEPLSSSRGRWFPMIGCIYRVYDVNDNNSNGNGAVRQ